MRPPAQVLSDMFDALATLMAEANPADQDAHNAEIAKVRDQITQAKADLAAENARMTAERAALDAQAYRLLLDQNASHEILKRKHRSRLPPVFEARDLFNTPGAGTSNPPVVNRAEAPGTGAPVQPRLMDPPRRTISYLSLSQRLRVIIPIRWTTLLLPLHDWRPSQLKVILRRRWRRAGLRSFFGQL